jgi:hypothetical protein
VGCLAVRVGYVCCFQGFHSVVKFEHWREYVGNSEQ